METKVTEDQFRQTLSDSFGFASSDIVHKLTVDEQFKLFQTLPLWLQLDCIYWGFDETVCRENIFTQIITNIGSITVDEYYANEWYKTKQLTMDDTFKFMEI